MAKVTGVHKSREKRLQGSREESRHEGFMLCSPDMTICGDCHVNRAKNKCPRLKEWLAMRRS